MNRRGALVMLAGTIVLWAISPILIRWVKDDFPVSFQNFTRYLFSIAILGPASVFGVRQAGRARPKLLTRALTGRLLIIATLNFVFQAGFTAANYLIMPGLFTLVFKSGVVISVLFAALLFADERKVLVRPGFLIGLAGSVAGVVLTIIGGGSLGHGSVLGIVVALASTTAWSLLGGLVKKWLPGIPSSYALSVVFVINIPLFLTVYLIGYGPVIPPAPLSSYAVMMASGLLAVGLAHYLFYRSVPVIGVSVAATLDLVRPLLAVVLSFFVFGERLLPLQIVGGGFLILGAYLVIQSRFRQRR